MSYELVAVVTQNSIALDNERFVTEVESAEKLGHGTLLYAWKPQTVREIYEQAERNYHQHNPTLDGQS